MPSSPGRSVHLEMNNHLQEDSHSNLNHQHQQQHSQSNNISDSINNGHNSDSGNGNFYFPPPNIQPYSYYSSAYPNPNSANHSSLPSSSSSNHSIHPNPYPPFNTGPPTTSHTQFAPSYPPPPPQWSPPDSNAPFHLPDAHPTPYQELPAPFPLPLGMRTVGGSSLPEEDENDGSKQAWDSFDIGGGPTRLTRKRIRPPPDPTMLGKTRCCECSFTEGETRRRVAVFSRSSEGEGPKKAQELRIDVAS